jgi:hypothetical protein
MPNHRSRGRRACAVFGPALQTLALQGGVVQQQVLTVQFGPTLHTLALQRGVVQQ